jgi:hypothetical protein
MPEIAAERRAILDWVDSRHRLDLFLTLHNTESNEYLEAPAIFQALGERLFRQLAENTSFHPTAPLRAMDPSTTPGKLGRMDVAQGLFHDRRLPAMTIEQMVEFNSKLGRVPTAADRKAFGAELVRALATAVMDSGKEH